MSATALIILIVITASADRNIPPSRHLIMAAAQLRT